jgi:hypothetical protein
VTFLLPGTAATAIGLTALAKSRKGITLGKRGARYGLSYVVTATPGVAREIFEKVAERAAPDFPRGEGQPSSWGHGCRKAMPRILKALDGETE